MERNAASGLSLGLADFVTQFTCRHVYNFFNEEATPVSNAAMNAFTVRLMSHPALARERALPVGDEMNR